MQTQTLTVKKDGFTISEIPKFIWIIAFVGIILALALAILGGFKGALDEGTAEYNATEDVIEDLAEGVLDWLPLLILIVMVTVIALVAFRLFGYFGGGTSMA